MLTLLARAWFWSRIAAVILVAMMLLPPVAGYARQYAFAQALQFVIFAAAGPALLALGIPRQVRSPDRPPGRGGRPRRPGARAAIVLAAFIAAAITWRLPATVNALARDPALAVAEMITLLAAGTGIWLELAGTLHGPGQLPRPARAAMAAAAMWTIWVLAYLTGMSGVSWFAAYRHGAPGGLSAAADQQIAVAILWAVPALCFLPVLYVTVITWLGGTTSAAGNEHRAAAGSPPRQASPAAGLALTACPVITALRPPVGGSPFPDHQMAPCWVEITHDGQFLFTVNTASGTISAYRIAASGALSLLPGSTPAGGAKCRRGRRPAEPGRRLPVCRSEQGPRRRRVRRQRRHPDPAGNLPVPAARRRRTRRHRG